MGKKFNKKQLNKMSEPKPTITASNSQATSTPVSATGAINVTIDSEATRETVQASIDLIEKLKKDAETQLDEAKAKSSEIIEKANAESKSIREKADEDAIAIKEEAKKKGIEEGQRTIAKEHEEAARQAKQIIETAQANSDQLKKETQQLYQEAESKLQSARLELSKIQAEKDAYKSEVESQSLEMLRSLEESVSTLQSKLQEKEREALELGIENNSLKTQVAIFESTLGDQTAKESEIIELKNAQAMDQSRIKNLRSSIDDINKKLADAYDLLDAVGEDPQAILDELKKCQETIERLEEDTNRVSEKQLAELREKSENYDALLERYKETTIDLISATEENKLLKLNDDELAMQRRFVKILESQKAELRAELDHYIESYNNRTERIFASLSEIDTHDKSSFKKTDIKNLEDLCEKFRNYMANRDSNPLYYEPWVVRTFIAGLATSKILILEGLSGTGKSSLPSAFESFITATTHMVPVQSSWKDRNDLLGFFNDFKQQYKETQFLKCLYSGCHDSNRIHCIVLDEMNLSRIEYYFADILSVLEQKDPTKWKVELISDFRSIRMGDESKPELITDSGELQITDNIWFIGTANKDDSTFTITDKVYDRAVVIEFKEKGERPSDADKSKKKADLGGHNLSSNQFKDLIVGAKESADKIEIGNALRAIQDLDDLIKNKFDITFGYRISNQINEFVPVYMGCGGSAIEAVDIIFSSKVLRKIDGLFDERTKTGLEEVKAHIEKNYPAMKFSKSRISLMESRL